MTPVAPRIGNDVSYVRTIKQSSHFSWQAQYLVRLDFLAFPVAQSRNSGCCSRPQPRRSTVTSLDEPA